MGANAASAPPTGGKRSRWDGLLDVWRVYRYALRPIADVEATADGRWRATGTNPQFALETTRPTRPSAGWYALRVRIRAEPPSVLKDPRLAVDYGSGISDRTCQHLALDPQAVRHRTLIRLEGHVHELRFDPTTQPGEFRCAGMSLRKLSLVEAALRIGTPIVWRLLTHPTHLVQAFRDAWAVLRREGISGFAQRVRLLGESTQRHVVYGNWVAHFDTLTDADRAAIDAQIAAMATTPRFSILLPVYETPERWLRECLDSVLAQRYPHWELCVADDASTSPHVRAVLEEYAGRDRRVKVAYRSENGHIAAASNTALELATGDYVALLDHDDVLPPHALYVVAERLVREPRLKLLYSDEDKIDEHGRRSAPYFKPDWNPDLILGQNYVNHLGVYQTALVRDVGGFRVGYEGSQDHDLVLRCAERLARDEIGHVPHVLYHWRAVRGSTALAGKAKRYTRSAGVRAVQDHLDRRGIDARAEELPNGYYRVCRPVPEPRPLVSLVIPTRDRVDLLRRCVDGILERTAYREFEILVVDNQSSEKATLDYLARIAQHAQVRVIPYDAPFSFSALNNHAVAQARGSIVGLLNNDLDVMRADWLDEMVAQVVRPEIGCVGTLLYYPDGRIQHAGVIVGYGGVAGHAYQYKPHGYAGQMQRARLVQEMSAVTAACLLVRADVYRAVGGLDEGLVVAFNDIDFCLRVQQRGLRNLYTPFAEFWHHESASRGYEDTPEKIARFNREIDFMQARWGATLAEDPNYNPNLAMSGEPFALAWPPRVEYPFRRTGANG